MRGKTYTFVVEGGNDPETPARFHPFYITDDSIGGYEHKTPEERTVRTKDYQCLIKYFKNKRVENVRNQICK